MALREPGGKGRLLRGVAAGLLAFAAGAALAMTLLPEWSTAGGYRDERFFRARFQRLAGRAGFELAPGEPRVSLAANGSALAEAYRRLGERAPAWLNETRSAVRARVEHPVGRPGEAQSQTLEISFSPDGRPLRIEWHNYALPFLSPTNPRLYELLADNLPNLLLAPGERMGSERRGRGAILTSWQTIELGGSSPAQHLLVAISPPVEVSVERRPGPPLEDAPWPLKHFGRILTALLLYLAIAVAVTGLFLVLLLQGRIDLTNGALLALVTLLSANFAEAFSHRAAPWMTVIFLFFSAPGRALGVFLVWSAGESLLRSLRPDFTTSLDTLRLGRLGPRGGRALLLGCAFGAALAGLRFGLYSLASLLPGISPAASSIDLPVFEHSPVGVGISVAAVVALALALGLRFLPSRWALPAAALLAGTVLSPVQIIPYPAELIANAGFAGLLVWICRRHGLTALLAASVVSLLLPAALFSALHFAWIPGAFILTSGFAALLLLFGFVGISRPEELETGRVPPPAFMRRLAEERRVHNEVDLLARMQVGLLPQEMPKVEGCEIAARSVLASEAGGDLYDFLRDGAGRLWIAAGDVAGHGYSCAVAQAMVKAGLLSLIEPEESPAEVLRQLDRVLRGASSDHSFTSLALVRLDPVTGEALVANAGHPYPLVFAAGQVAEIELPGLPLGHGPARGYADRNFDLPAGGAILLCSDGLFEALDRNGNAYGFDRVREVFQVMGHRPAIEIVDALLNDCRRHLGAEPAPDDVTVVVVKRG